MTTPPPKNKISRNISLRLSGLMTTRSDVADNPDEDIRRGLWVVFLFFGVLLGVAALVRVDAAVVASGSIIVSSSRQSVQHKEGGIVSTLSVKEGDHVKKNQVLIHLAGGEIEASARAVTAQYIDLKAQEARLLAEQAGQAHFNTPPEFMNLDTTYTSLIDKAIALQRRALSANRELTNAQILVLTERENQALEQIAGSQEQMAANVKRRRLTLDELDGVKDLYAKGYAPMPRLRALEASIAGLEGEYGAFQADVARVQAQISEIRMQILSMRRERLDQGVKELSDTQMKLKTLEPQMLAAAEAYERLKVRATATGKVMGLNAFTVGGVINAGQKVMEIVPDAEPLVIQIRIPVHDGNDVHSGEVAQVQFSSLHDRNIPVLIGRVIDVSADSFMDEVTHQSFYTGRVEITPEVLETLSVYSHRASLKPGLPVEVVIPTRKRTFLDYLLEPLNQSLWKTFREP